MPFAPIEMEKFGRNILSLTYFALLTNSAHVCYIIIY